MSPHSKKRDLQIFAHVLEIHYRLYIVFKIFQKSGSDPNTFSYITKHIMYPRSAQALQKNVNLCWLEGSKLMINSAISAVEVKFVFDTALNFNASSNITNLVIRT